LNNIKKTASARRKLKQNGSPGPVFKTDEQLTYFQLFYILTQVLPEKQEIHGKMQL
ncbi:MAG: hypothetical protein GY940_29370, partial [bacterium]|nr:hypothetical protein [bacterium]